MNKTNVLNTFNKNASDLLYNNHHRVDNNNNNKKINTKDLSMKLGKHSFKFNFLNNLKNK